MGVVVFLFYAPLLGFTMGAIGAALAPALGIKEGAGTVFGFLLAVLAGLLLARASRAANDAPASNWARATIGPFYIGFLLLPLLVLGGILPETIYESMTGRQIEHLPARTIGWVAPVYFLALLAVCWFVILPWLKPFVAFLLKPVLTLIREGQIGKGGSAAFGGIIDDWAARHRPGAILLGTSLYDRSWKVGHADDRGFLTIASSRSGKGRSAIIPNLITWPESALVIDPKGTNAAVTARRRVSLGQSVHVVDPFGITPFPENELAQFNPLAAVNLNSDRVTEDIMLVADALVVSDSGEDSHWNEAARAIIAGTIAHLLTSGKGATLVDLRDALKKGADELDDLFGEMLHDHSAGGLPAAAASLVTSAGPNERGSFFTTVMKNLAWLDSVVMRKALGPSDLDLADLKRKAMTVYVVLPPEFLGTHKRFMRLFVNVAIRGLSQGGRGSRRVLFLLDEFYSLGNLALIEQAAGLLSGYGMKLWPIVQNLTQLQQLYPKNWETFFANAGAVQVFSVNDRATAEYLVARLGSRVVSERQGQQVMRTVVALREVEELGRDVSRERGRQIIYRSGDDPLVLRRLRYDKDFPAYKFAPDPDYAAEPKPGLADRLAAIGDWARWAFRPYRPALPTPADNPLALDGPPVTLPEPAPQAKAEPAPATPQAPAIDFGKIIADMHKDAPFAYVRKLHDMPPPDFTTGAGVADSAPVKQEPSGHDGLTFDALMAAPVASTKHAIFERYQLLQERAGEDEARLSRAALWLTGGYHENLHGPDPFAADERGAGA